MTSLVFALSEDYAQATGGYVYDQRLLAELERLGWHVQRLMLPAGFPRPTDEARRQTDSLLAGLPDGTLMMTDQLCIDVLPEVAATHGGRLRLVTIVHHPLAAEGAGPSDAAVANFRDEKAALQHASLVLVTSETTARTLISDYDVAAARLIVAPPGTDALPLSRGGGAGAAVQLLGVGAVVPRKGQDLLVEVLASLSALAWRLTLVGNLERAPDFVTQLKRRVAATGLGDRITLAGELATADLEAHWQSTDVFVSASRHEGFGMAIAEALARGLPVVTTAAGAVADWLPADAGVLVPTADTEALVAALGQVISDAAYRRRLRQGALDARARLPSWSATGVIVNERLAALVAAG